MPAKLDNRREIELAEGVHIHLRPAGIFPRMMARLIDVAILIGIYFALAITVGLIGSFSGSEASAGIYQLSAFVLLWFYDPLFEASKWAASPGKRLVGLKVVRKSGAPVGFASGFLRGLLFWIDVLPGLGSVGMTSILASKNSQRLGDLVADTLVIYSKPQVLPVLPKIQVSAIRPGVTLQREEQLAFLQFGERSANLSQERLGEIAAPLVALDGSQNAPSPASFALGVAHWLSKNEK